MIPPQRFPRKPDYLGGHGWLIRGFILLSFVTSNFASTQYIAHRFGYHANFGKPLYKIERVAIYQPFAWAVWAWKWHQRYPALRPVFFQATGVQAGGLVLTWLIAIATVSARRRRLVRGMEHLHGSAHWATEQDVHATGLLDSGAGVYVGGWCKDGYLNYLQHNGPEHVLAFAPTRSGKGVSLVIPTLLAWQESALIYDIKGENWAKTAGWRAASGQVCYKFSPVEESGGSRFNPLAELRLGTIRDVSDAQNMAEILIRVGEHQEKSHYHHWEDSGVSFATGVILHTAYCAKRDGRIATLAEVAGTLTRPGVHITQTLVEMRRAIHDPQGIYGWTTPAGVPTRTHPVVAQKAQDMLDREEEERSGVLSATKTPLALFSDPLIAGNTSTSDFRVQDLVNGERPVSLYLVVPPSDKLRLRNLIRLVFTTIVNRLTERLEFAATEQQRNRYRLLFLIDEFPSLGQMKLFGDALSYMAGYGLKAYLFAQDIRQIVDSYGTNESIVSNCQVRVAFAPNQHETAELLSKMTGTTTVEKADLSFSGKRHAVAPETVMATATQVERPLMTPDEIMRLTPPKKEGTGAAERITEPGEMLVFVSGHPPILGWQMLYFRDPVLSQRSTIAPPMPARLPDFEVAEVLVNQPHEDTSNVDEGLLFELTQENDHAI